MFWLTPLSYKIIWLIMNDYHNKLKDRLENLKAVESSEDSTDNIGSVLPNKKVWKKSLKYVDELGVKDPNKRLELALMIYNSHFQKDLYRAVSRINNNVIFFFWAMFGIWIVLALWILGVGIFNAI